ncbi:hypothetical protein JTM17_33440, partial [Pseudomonas aeruginosa]|nr:hypothetical protein [Pseudomonas aeruginosa]
YGEQAYEDGYRVYTTITRKNQQAAQQAVRNNVLDYDMRHGYRGPASITAPSNTLKSICLPLFVIPFSSSNVARTHRSSP